MTLGVDGRRRARLWHASDAPSLQLPLLGSWGVGGVQGGKGRARKGVELA